MPTIKPGGTVKVLPQPISWRTIEFHTCEILREAGIELDKITNSGDTIILFGKQLEEYNLTLFARALAERLA